MASINSSMKTLRNLSRRASRLHQTTRSLQTASKCLAAQNFSMPAMSPTMTEGNITSWKIKEGDSFSTGDVLLEIETDKAQMDVEAQEDGILAKITQVEGAKAVKVGTRIAVIAEQDDDLSTLEMPPYDVGQKAPLQEKEPSDRRPAAEAEASNTSSPAESQSARKPAQSQKQTYPLYPSIAQLLNENGLSAADADSIPATGPKGRLLKGDVLAYLGQINSQYSSEQSERIKKLGHLDLSNAKPAPRTAPTPALESSAGSGQATESTVEEVRDTEVAIPISLSSALAVQKRLQDTLGVHLPLSTFIARATELANEDLPRANGKSPAADELFNDILGIAATSSSSNSHGLFTPQIMTLPQADKRRLAPASSRSPDAYDILTNTQTQPRATARSSSTILERLKEADPGNSIFSVSAAKGEEQRARVFLERMKTILQTEPGRLIL